MAQRLEHMNHEFMTCELAMMSMGATNPQERLARKDMVGSRGSESAAPRQQQSCMLRREKSKDECLVRCCSQDEA